MPETLADMLRRTGPLPWRQVIAIARGACNALAQMHDGKLVHGDLQPQNIYVTKRAGDGDTFDIGIAKIVGNTPSDGIRLDYQAPEHVLGDVTPACDIYSLGVVMFEMIVGSWPPPSGGAPVFHLQRAQVPSELAQIVVRCMSPAPQARFGVRELASTLDGLRAGAKRTSRPHPDGPAQIANTPLQRGVEPPVGIKRWGVAHEQLSHPDPHYTDHALPKYRAGAQPPAQSAQPAPPNAIAATPQPVPVPVPVPAPAPEARRRAWLLIGLLCTIAVIVALLISI